MRGDDLHESIVVWQLHAQMQTATHERRRELALSVAGHEHHWERFGLHAPAGNLDPLVVIVHAHSGALSGVRQPDQFGDLVLAVLEHVQQIVGQVDVALVDLVDQQYAGSVSR